MVKLTPQRIDEAVERTNPIRERELILRGLKFSVIENLGIGLDHYDSYDLCDNDIQKLGNFPNLVKCKQLFVNNNRISYISGDLSKKLPNLEEICAVNNDLNNLSNIKRLEKCNQLKYLSFIRNPLVLQPHYRRYVIYAIKNLKFLDFSKITNDEKQDAKKFFEEETVGKMLLAKINQQAKEESENVMADINDSDDEDFPTPVKSSFDIMSEKQESDSQKQLREISETQRSKIKAAILNATSIEEVERLNRMLQAGYVPE